MPYLDGEPVDEKVINPKLHKFVGLFRQPSPPDVSDLRGNVICAVCRRAFHESLYQCWQAGHFDSPQYVAMHKLDIPSDEETRKMALEESQTLTTGISSITTLLGDKQLSEEHLLLVQSAFVLGFTRGVSRIRRK